MTDEIVLVSGSDILDYWIERVDCSEGLFHLKWKTDDELSVARRGTYWILPKGWKYKLVSMDTLQAICNSDACNFFIYVQPQEQTVDCAKEITDNDTHHASALPTYGGYMIYSGSMAYYTQEHFDINLDIRAKNATIWFWPNNVFQNGGGRYVVCDMVLQGERIPLEES
jgi:hypothetical protein